MTLPEHFWQTLGATGLLVALIYLVHRGHARLQRQIEIWRRVKKEGLAAQAAKVVSIDRLANRLAGGLSAARWVLLAALFVRFVGFELRQFPDTRAWGDWVVNVVLMPFKAIYDSFVDYIPSGFQLLAVVITTRYLLLLVHRVFLAMEAGSLKIDGFYPEWAEPTYKVARFLILAMALVAVFPYLPGSSSPAFQTVSVFVGVVFSLGSTSVVANTVGGIVLTYMRALRVGDRVKIREVTGDVVERTLLAVKLRTVQNEIVTIPNGMLQTSTILNYSARAAEGQLILRANVTIGYDAPWPRVHEALRAAAERTPQVLTEPAPFVLQTALNDYNVAYSLNVYTAEAQRIQFILSDLHQNIQETFDEAGIEILSPMYNTIRQSMANDTLEARPPGPSAG